MIDLHLPSPAKINLFLHVVGRRPDGYHLLQTAFQFVDLHDQLSFRLRGDEAITLETSQINLPLENNLVYRAALLLREYSNCPKGVDILLEKKIPLGSGLGGGSSNAATTLLGLNHLWKLGLSQETISYLGLKLGADIPIFIQGFSAFGEGIGEKLQSINPPEDWVLLLFPPCQVETAKIFSDPQLTRNTPEITIARFFKAGGRNDCEPIVRKYFPEVANALDWLTQFSPARMTGTGSCIFATFKDKVAALEVAKGIPAPLRGIVAKGLNTSPLRKIINNF